VESKSPGYSVSPAISPRAGAGNTRPSPGKGSARRAASGVTDDPVRGGLHGGAGDGAGQYRAVRRQGPRRRLTGTGGVNP